MDKQETKEKPSYFIRIFSCITRKWNKIPNMICYLIKGIIVCILMIILIFITLKITIGLTFPIPIVVVISGSMLHEEGDNTWNTWLNARGITDEQISKFPLKDGFARGDMIVTMRPTAKLGDVVIRQGFFTQFKPQRTYNSPGCRNCNN